MARNQSGHPVTPSIGAPPNHALTPHSRCLECTMGAGADGGEALNHPPHRRSLASCLLRGIVGPLLSQRITPSFSRCLQRFARPFVSPLFGISLGLFPSFLSFLPRILICRRPSCSGATKEREGEIETSVPFFLLSDKQPQDRPQPNLFCTSI